MSAEQVTAESKQASIPGKSSKQTTSFRFLVAIKALLLPVLLAIFPPLFHYGNNAGKVILPSLGRTIVLYFAISVIVYLIFLIINRGDAYSSANAAFIFLLFFNLYGAFYNASIKLDVFRVEDYTLFPLFFLIALYAAWFASKIKPIDFWKTALFVTAVLVTFNIIKIIPVEIKKYRTRLPEPAQDTPAIQTGSDTKSPDIYYFLFDEFASLDTMRTYFNYQKVDDFKDYLSAKGFFVSEGSQGNSIDTLHQMSQRLNYKVIDLDSSSLNSFFEAIAHNQVMADLKARGYSLVVFNELNFGYPAMPPISADYAYLYGSNEVTNDQLNTGMLFDDFGVLVAQNTMLRILNLPNRKTLDPMFIKHKDMIHFTQNKVTQLNDTPSPKFVYVHLLLPHYPFMFKEDGSLNQPGNFYNWNSYTGNYKFTINYIQKIVADLLEQADPENPPVIILQSDHGPRNIVVENRGGVPLQNFPEELKTHILNAFYLPGCDSPGLTQQMNPINTFPIVFNCYFDAGIPLQE